MTRFIDRLQFNGQDGLGTTLTLKTPLTWELGAFFMGEPGDDLLSHT